MRSPRRIASLGGLVPGNTGSAGLLLLLLASAGLSGCGDRPEPLPPTAAGSGPTVPPKPDSHELRGVVRQVNRETGVVAIRHEAIPGFMPAMTMPFDLKGQDALEDLQVGDQVKGTLRIEGGDAVLRDVEITEMATAPAPEPVVVPTLKPGEQVPDFTVTLQDGETLRLSDLRGKVVVMTFIYTRCPLPNFCPLMDRNFSELSRWVQANPNRVESVRLLSVSFDPEHDTPEALTRHAQLRGARPPVWRFAVASHEELHKVAGPLGLRYAPTGEEIIHGLSTSVIGPDGKLRLLLEGNSWETSQLRQAISRLIREDSPGKNSDSGPPDDRP